MKVALHQRLYCVTPSRGAWRSVRGHPRLPLEVLRGLVAVVSQDAYLFHGTAEDNLRLGKPGASLGELEAAARAANAHGFIIALPQGIGPWSENGERQRIAIAPALLKDAPILILDEVNESAIRDALKRLARGRTTITIAHRFSSVVHADRIVVLGERGGWSRPAATRS